jgi:Lrp/AsnC family transcriptional regulator, leucine-responsive regulatory protein
MTYKLDEKDEKIIEVLKEHGDYTTRQIAKKTLLPATTIHNRIRKLKQEKIIRKFTLDLDPQKLGKNFLVIMLVSMDYKVLRELKKDQHQIAKQISLLPEVESVDVVTGGTDMVVKVRVKDVQEYDHFLLKKFQSLPGIDRTQSLVVIHEQ